MMKKLYYIIVTILVLGCNSEDAPDCFQSTGNSVTKEIEVSDFNRILVNPNVELILKQGETTTVIIETGDNLLNEVFAEVEDGRLVVSNTNDCTFFRGINQTKVFVTSPDIVQIRSATQFDIASDGVLAYPDLSLISEDFNEDAGTTTGTFNLKMNSENISVVGNNIASFFISGAVENLSVRFFSGTGRFEGNNLIAQNVQVVHRGTNKIIVNPQQSIKGEIRSTGDVISLNKPPAVEVETFFTGKLIFQ